jgi:hypothetical protein
LLGAGLVVGDLLLLAALWPDLSTAPWGVAAGVALITSVVLVTGCFLFVLHIRTDVRNGEIGLALWPYWRVRLRISDLSARSSTTSPSTWHGIGLRRGHGSSGQVYRALLLDAGPAVILLDNTSGVTYVVRSDHVDRLLHAMRHELHPQVDSAPDRRVTTAQASIDPAITYPAIFERLQHGIPRDGEAATVQAELLRAVQNLEDEARRNGNENWDDRHRRQLDYLRRHLTDGTLPEGRSTIEFALDSIAQVDSPQTHTAVWIHLINATCEWALAHPSPLHRALVSKTTDDDRTVAQFQDRSLAEAPTNRLREVVGAWACNIVPASAVVLVAAELVAETEDSAFVPIAALPLAVERADLWPVLRDAFTASDPTDALEDQQLELSALAWLCRSYLAAEIPGVRVVTWASAASGPTAPRPLGAFAELAEEFESGLSRDRFEHELHDQAAAFLLGR